MFKRYDYNSAFDFDQDRDLVALMNETGDPEQLRSLAKTARHRLRARAQETGERQTGRRSSRRLALPRALTPRTWSH